jgi:hypothetical protein
MSDVISHAGPLGGLVVLGAVIGLVACAAFGGLAFTRRRVPLGAIVLIPYLILAVGAFGAWVGTTSVLGDVASAEPNKIPLVAMAGAWNALMVDWLARWGAAIVLAAGAWAAAIGAAVVPGSEPRFTPVAGIGAAVASGIGAIVLLAMTAHYGLGGSAYLLALLVLVSGMAVAAAATRRATDDDMFRVAGMRFAASMAMLFGVFHAIRAVDIGNRISAFAADSEVLNTFDLHKAIALFSATVDPGVTIGVVALFIALLIAFFGFFAEIGEVVVRYTMFDMFAVVALMVLVGALRVVESSGFNSVYRVATNEPAVEMYKDVGTGLAAAAITRGETAYTVRMADGGFGDVYAFEGEEWIRKFRWNGRKWIDQTSWLEKLEEAKDLGDRPPLIAVERGMQADRLIPLLEKYGGKGFLMMRASEVKAGTFVPIELARLQTTFLPIEIRPTRDLKTELWLTAGSAEVNYGPTAWYGPKDDSLDPVEYATAALGATKAPGVLVLVTGRKINDIVTSCLPYMVDEIPAAEGSAEPAPAPVPAPAEGHPAEGGLAVEGAPTSGTLAMNNTRWCGITPDEFDAVRTEAASLWDMPAPANVKMEIALQGPVKDRLEVEGLVRPELGGLGYCGETAVAAGEVLKGRMTLELALAKDGHVYDTLVDPKSKIQSPTILRCAAKRFRKLTFTLNEVPATPPPPPKPVKGKRGKPPEPPPPPRVIVNLDFI